MDPNKGKVPIEIKFDAISLMAVHGACCLGLRHPKYTGPSRELVLNFVKKAEEGLLESGLLTTEDIKLIHKVEHQEGPHDTEEGL